MSLYHRHSRCLQLMPVCSSHSRHRCTTAEDWQGRELSDGGSDGGGFQIGTTKGCCILLDRRARSQEIGSIPGTTMGQTAGKAPPRSPTDTKTCPCQTPDSSDIFAAGLPASGSSLRCSFVGYTVLYGILEEHCSYISLSDFK